MTDHAARKQKSREEQLRHQHLNKSARRFAEDYVQDGYPVPYERVFYFNAFKIRIVAEPRTTKDDTQPLGNADSSETLK